MPTEPKTKTDSARKAGDGAQADKEEQTNKAQKNRGSSKEPDNENRNAEQREKSGAGKQNSKG